MESGTTWGNWVAYAAICIFLFLALVVVARTMLMFATLTFMPVARILSRVKRSITRGS
jgi:hypothetical protein